MPPQQRQRGADLADDRFEFCTHGALSVWFQGFAGM
jgi:hypothetical protein